MSAAHLLVALFCLLALTWALRVLTHAVIDGHRRGIARVHQRGASWSPHIPRQETRR